MRDLAKQFPLQYLVGYFLGDGSWSEQTHKKYETHLPQLVFYGCEEDRERIKQAFHQLEIYWNECTVGTSNSWRVTLPVQWHSLFRDWIEPGTSRTKKLPTKFYTASPEEKAAVISGYWDADGGVHERPNRCATVRVKSASLVLLTGVSEYLRSLDIEHSLRPSHTGSIYYHLRITALGCVKFAKLVSLRDDKMKWLNKLVSTL